MVAKQAPGADPPKEAPRLTRALRIELAKPLGAHAWEEVGPLLRAQRSVQHRLLNAAILAAIEYDNRKRRGEPVAVLRGENRSDGIPNPSTAAYRACEEELTEIRAWAKKTLASGKAGDRSRVLEHLAADATPRAGGKFLSPLFTPETKSVIGQVAFSHFQKWQKDKSATEIPSWGQGAPLFIRADAAHLDVDASGKLTLTLKHAFGFHVTWALRAGKGSHYGQLRALAAREGDRRMGDVKLKYDERSRKWFALVAYSEPKPQPPKHADPAHVLILHRGQRNLLVAMSNRGRYLVVARGGKIRDIKRKFFERRKSLQMLSAAERGAGGTGHGSNRRYATRDAIETREQNWLKTELQRIGQKIADLVRQWGVGTVLIEDYGGIGPDETRAARRFLERFPNHQLKQCVAWSLQKIGLTLGEYASEYISQTCPRCGQQDSAQHNFRTGVFHCSNPVCHFERDVDFVAGLHALRRSCGGNAGEWEKRLKAEARLTEEIRNVGTDPTAGPRNAGELARNARNAGAESQAQGDRRNASGAETALVRSPRDKVLNAGGGRANPGADPYEAARAELDRRNAGGVSPVRPQKKGKSRKHK